MYVASFNPLSSRWLVLNPDGTAYRGGLSGAVAAELAESLNRQAA